MTDFTTLSMTQLDTIFGGCRCDQQQQQQQEDPSQAQQAQQDPAQGQEQQQQSAQGGQVDIKQLLGTLLMQLGQQLAGGTQQA